MVPKVPMDGIYQVKILAVRQDDTANYIRYDISAWIFFLFRSFGRIKYLRCADDNTFPVCGSTQLRKEAFPSGELPQLLPGQGPVVQVFHMGGHDEGRWNCLV